MLIRLLLIIGLSLLASKDASTQFIYYDTKEAGNIAEIKEQIEEARQTRDSLQKLGYVAETFTIFNVDNNLWMTADGRLDVYEWKGHTWKNLYKGTYHGYNYKSQQFILNNKLYSYRGYGFWREHGEIIEYLPEKGEWEIIPETQNLPFGIGYVSDSIFYVYADVCYEINLDQQSVKTVECRFDIRGEIPHGREYFFEDYVMIAGNLTDGSNIPLISKTDNNLFLSQRKPFFGLRDPLLKNSLIHIIGNEFKIYYPDSRVVEYKIADELEYYLLEANQQNPKTSLWMLILAFILIVGIIFYAIKKRSRAIPDHELLNRFQGSKGQLIDSDMLDSILGIDNITVYETRKHKRASLILEINSLSQANQGRKLIVREKDPSDKRFYLYRIQ